MSILVLGTVALDSIKTPCGKKDNVLGGSAAHFSMSARLFTPVELVAIVGEDFPAEFIEFLRRRGIILTSLIKGPGKTFRWEGKYEGDLNSALTLNTELGVLLAFRPVISPEQKNIENVFLANVDPEIQSHLLKDMRQSRLVGLDSMNYWISHKRRALLKLLRQVNIFVANDQEARSLSGEINLIKAARYLHSCGPDMVVIKKGENGVLVLGKGFISVLPAYPMEKVIDPTGAGDTFAGGFMGYLARARKINHRSIKKAIAYGTVAASFNVEGFGMDRTARLTLADVDKRLETFRRIIMFP